METGSTPHHWARLWTWACSGNFQNWSVSLRKSPDLLLKRSPCPSSDCSAAVCPHEAFAQELPADSWLLIQGMRNQVQQPCLGHFNIQLRGFLMSCFSSPIFYPLPMYWGGGIEGSSFQVSCEPFNSPVGFCMGNRWRQTKRNVNSRQRKKVGFFQPM